MVECIDEDAFIEQISDLVFPDKLYYLRLKTKEYYYIIIIIKIII